MGKAKPIVFVGAMVTVLILVLSVVITIFLFPYRDVVNTTIWMFVGIFTVVTMFIMVVFFMIFGRRANLLSIR